jgi:integrase
VAPEAGEPFTEEEVAALLAGTGTMRKYGSHGFSCHHETFRLILELMLATGMRVGDATLYNPAAAVKSERLWIYRYTPQKTRRVRPKTAEVFIPDALKVAIDKCHWMSDRLPFSWGDSSGDWIARKVYHLMGAVGRRCGIPDCRPHRLRDTFAVRCLLAGMQLDDVSRLLGHSSVKVTETHYAKWTPARGLRLERLVAETLTDPGRH